MLRVARLCVVIVCFRLCRLLQFSGWTGKLFRLSFICAVFPNTERQRLAKAWVVWLPRLTSSFCTFWSTFQFLCAHVLAQAPLVDNIKLVHQWHCQHLNLKITFFHCHFPACNISPFFHIDYWCTVTAMLLHMFTWIFDWLIDVITGWHWWVLYIMLYFAKR